MKVFSMKDKVFIFSCFIIGIVVIIYALSAIRTNKTRDASMERKEIHVLLDGGGVAALNCSTFRPAGAHGIECYLVSIK